MSGRSVKKSRKNLDSCIVEWRGKSNRRQRKGEGEEEKEIWLSGGKEAEERGATLVWWGISRAGRE